MHSLRGKSSSWDKYIGATSFGTKFWRYISVATQEKTQGRDRNYLLGYWTLDFLDLVITHMLIILLRKAHEHLLYCGLFC